MLKRRLLLLLLVFLCLSASLSALSPEERSLVLKLQAKIQEAKGDFQHILKLNNELNYILSEQSITIEQLETEHQESILLLNQELTLSKKQNESLTNSLRIERASLYWKIPLVSVLSCSAVGVSYSLVNDTNIINGALIGAGTGAVTGLISAYLFNRHYQKQDTNQSYKNTD